MIPLLFTILLLNGCTLNKEEQEHKNNVIDKAIPLFDKYTTIESLIKVYENRSNEFKPLHSVCWTYYALALLYAAKSDYDTSKNFFDKCVNSGKNIFVEYVCSWFEKIGTAYYTRINEVMYKEYSKKSIDDLFRISIEKKDHWAIKLAKKCKDILEDIASEKKDFNDILEENRKITFEKLGLERG